MSQVDAAKKRRDAKLKETRRRQSFKLGLFFLAAAALFVLAYYIYNSEVWLIRSVEVTGNRRLSERSVKTMAALGEKTSLLKLPAARIQAAIEADPLVKEVRLVRLFPDRLRIEIVERRPFVGVRQRGSVYMLDESGFVVGKQTRLGTDTPVPVVSDIRADKLRIGRRTASQLLRKALRTLAVVAPELRAKITWVSVPSWEKLAFQTVDNVEIIFGTTAQSRKKNLVIKKILENPKGKIVHINVTAPANPVVRRLKD